LKEEYRVDNQSSSTFNSESVLKIHAKKRYAIQEITNNA